MTRLETQDIRQKPFLKWAGGKRWLVNDWPDLLPDNYNQYVEPFLGSGAVYFYLAPKTAILGDVNPDLIETYQMVKSDWKTVVRLLKKHQKNHSRYHYMTVRNFIPATPEARAARFIYLNRTCWNGLYRVNQLGLFNVPMGDRNTVLFPDDDFAGVSKTLKGARLLKSDFEPLINRAKKDDLLFVDPPYTVSHNQNGFIKYNEKLFSWDDQERLFRALVRAKSRGVKIIATNAYHIELRRLYRNEFAIKQISRQGTIASAASSRKKFEELLISTEI